MPVEEIHPTFMDIAVGCLFWFGVWIFFTGVTIHLIWLMRLIQLIPIDKLMRAIGVDII